MFINEEIKDKEIRVVASDGTQLGIMPTKDALAMAKKENLDLVNIAPKAVPPVCRIRKKKQRKSKKWWK